MNVELGQLGAADIAAHNAGEDAATIRWLTGGVPTVESTTAHFRALARNAESGRGARGFGVWVDDRLAGYVECNPDITDGLNPGDVNISYAVHPWARGRGVAVEAVRLMCDFIRTQRLGLRAAIRVEPENVASVRVAERCGFTFVYNFESTTDNHPDGSAASMNLYCLDLHG